RAGSANIMPRPTVDESSSASRRLRRWRLGDLGFDMTFSPVDCTLRSGDQGTFGVAARGRGWSGRCAQGATWAETNRSNLVNRRRFFYFVGVFNIRHFGTVNTAIGTGERCPQAHHGCGRAQVGTLTRVSLVRVPGRE